MSITDEPTKAVLGSCTFCKKTNNQVQKLIAGPGVYICDECVGLCQEILTDEGGPARDADARAKFENRSVDEILDALPALGATANEVEAELGRWVVRLRAQGTDWDRIGAALSLGLDEARSRFEAAR